MARKQRTDTAAGDISAFAGALSAITPPKPLDDNEMVYWTAITRARARDDWTAIDLLLAWNLSKMMWQIQLSHAEIAEQGMTVENARGTPVDNPAFSRLEKLTRLSVSLSAKLHVHAEATVGKSEDSAKRATKQRQAEQTLENVSEEKTLADFIAQPKGAVQ